MGHKTRVLFVSHTYRLGANQRKLDALAKQGIEVGALVPREWKEQGGLYSGTSFAAARRYDSFRLYPGSVMRSGRKASYLFYPWELGRAVWDFKPHIIHVEQEVYSLTTVQVALAAKLSRAVLVVFGWENVDRKLHYGLTIARNAVISLTDLMICGNVAGGELLRRYGYRGRIEVMPQLGVAPKVFHPRRPVKAGTDLTVGYMGRLVPEKGLDVLLTAVSSLAKKGFRLRCLICGSGPCREPLESLAEDLGISDLIDWNEAVSREKVPDIMEKIDIFVLPSVSVEWWEEQFGLVIPQAMAMGIPVVGSQSGAIPEVIGRDDTIFPEGDQKALAGILKTLILSEEKRRELSEYGIERVKANYTFERIAEQLSEIYESIRRRPKEKNR